jgi:hypothetical protein
VGGKTREDIVGNVETLMERLHADWLRLTLKYRLKAFDAACAKVDQEWHGK